MWLHHMTCRIHIFRLSGYRTRSVLCMPIRDHDGHTLAVIQVINKRGYTDPLVASAFVDTTDTPTSTDTTSWCGFDKNDEQVLAAITAQIADSLRKHRHEVLQHQYGHEAGYK